MALFARLKLAHKLLICSTMFLLPVTVLLYYTLSGFQEQIRFTSREMAGARALQPLCKLAVVLGGRQMDSIAATVDSLFADIRKAESEVGPLLPATADAGRSLKAVSLHPAEAENARIELLRQIYSVLPHLAETANLILDPNLDSYYLADLALLRVPSLHEALTRDPAAVPDPAELKRVEHALAIALAEKHRKQSSDSVLETDLPRLLAALKESTGGAARLEAVSALWQTAAAELGVLLGQRAADLRGKQLIALVLSVAAVAFAAGMLLIVVRNISIPLAGATQIADKIAAGRLSSAEASLSQPVIRKYLGSAAGGEVQDEALRLLGAFDSMAKSLDSLVNEVRKAYEDVDDSTSKMAAALTKVEASFAEQAASTSQVAASGKEIFANVNELARNMRTVTSMAAEAANLASAGLAGLGGINTAMQDTIEGAASVSGFLNTISTKAADVNSVLSNITKIANRTNLISLNAAIQAEKADQHAAGFTAVGLEIRRVADQTAVAALDIEKMLGDMQAAVKEGNRCMAEYAERLRTKSDDVASITADIGRSIECTRRLEPHFQTVDAGMQMQAQAAHEILQAMQQLSGAAGQSRDSLARFHEIAERVRATVNGLQAEVARFSVV